MLPLRAEWLHPARRAILGAALVLLTPACQASQSDTQSVPHEEARPRLGLMTSLPIFWGEPADMNDLLAGTAEQHWLRARLEEDYALVPLDVLGTAQGQPYAELSGIEFLVVAQPRALTPADNVALDQWVRDGGKLLLVLDPMMTEHSEYPIGDKRRFNDVALIPPVLARWGLQMRFQEGALPREAAFDGATIPVEEFGSLTPVEPAGGSAASDCSLEGAGVIARCRIGRGRVLVVADAAFLNRADGEPASPHAVDAVLAAAFG